MQSVVDQNIIIQIMIIYSKHRKACTEMTNNWKEKVMGSETQEVSNAYVLF